MLPLDVANARFDMGFDMELFWKFVYMLIAIMIVFLFPFAIILYETDDEKNMLSRISTTVCYLIVTTAVVTNFYLLDRNINLIYKIILVRIDILSGLKSPSYI